MNNATTAMPPAWQRMRDRWRSANPVVRDSIGAVALMALALLPLGIKGVQLGELHREVGSWAAVVLMAGQTLPLAVRRTQPALALLVIGVAFGVTQTIGADTGLAGLGLLIALYSCAAHLRRGRVVTIVGCGVGYLVLVAVLIAQGSPEEVIDWITFAAVLAVPWVAGELARRWRVEQAARFERAAAAADR